MLQLLNLLSGILLQVHQLKFLKMKYTEKSVFKRRVNPSTFIIVLIINRRYISINKIFNTAKQQDYIPRLCVILLHKYMMLGLIKTIKSCTSILQFDEGEKEEDVYFNINLDLPVTILCFKKHGVQATLRRLPFTIIRKRCGTIFLMK